MPLFSDSSSGCTVTPPRPVPVPVSVAPSSSRNDLFNTSWKADIPPPPPPPPRASAIYTPGSGTWATGTASGSGSRTSNGSSLIGEGLVSGQPFVHAATMPAAIRRREPIFKMDIGQVDEFGTSTTTADMTGTVPAPQVAVRSKPVHDISISSRTSSFFDVSPGNVTPPPAPRLASTTTGSSGAGVISQTPTNISRSSSLRKVPPPPLPLGINDHTEPYRLVEVSPDTPSTSSRQHSGDSYSHSYTPLSPLHQSPSLPPSESGLSDWQPPLPPSAEDIQLRFSPTSTYLLGEGRYARVFLAAYKQNRKGKGRARDLLGRASELSTNHLRPDVEAATDADDLKVNEDGDGLVGGAWRLCAAKRLAADRESQTMGLREAFFLHRLKGTPMSSKSSSPPQRNPSGIRSRRARAVSPLRDSFNQSNVGCGSVAGEAEMAKPKRNGSVYVVKLIAVKEDIEVIPHAGQTHARSASDALKPEGRSGTLTRQRSSTFISGDTLISSPVENQNRPDLSSFPSLPSLAQAARHESTAPSVSRLVLLLEHAPLGTLDRMLRTSPQLVGRNLWERWAREGAEALEWVHGKGVVHADVKPGNLLLTTDLHIRLSDFGSSLLIHPDHPPSDGVGLGTLPFSPPELVDPKQTFSFPVDVFALGATLYQCLTGREPFRGVRTVEMMHHVRKGGLWDYEERERLSRIGHEAEASVGGSPYPSAWRQASGFPSGSTSAYNAGVAGVRRAGSLRVPSSYSRSHLDTTTTTIPEFQSRPRLNRMTSAESLRASDELASSNSESPAGVKLWANWVKNSALINASGRAGPAMSAISMLLSEDEFPESPTTDVSRRSSMRRALDRLQTEAAIRSPSGSGAQTGSATSPTSISTNGASPTDLHVKGAISVDLADDQEQSIMMNVEEAKEAARQLFEPYSDGSPAMLYLNGQERVSEEIREVIRGMLERDQSNRLSAVEVRERWDQLAVASGDGEFEEEM